MSKKNIIFMKDFVESSWGSISDEPLLQGTASQLTLEQDYKKALYELNAHNVQLLELKITPEMFGSKVPESFNKYIEQLGIVYRGASKLRKLTGVDLNSLPQSELDSLNRIKATFDYAIENVSILENDPTDDVAKGELKSAILRMKRVISYLISETQNLLKDMEDCSGEVDSQAEALCAIANIMLKDKDVDAQHIKKLNSDIESLKQEIDTCTGIIIAHSISAACMIGLSAIAVCVAGPIGMLVWIFTGAGIAVNGYYIAINSIKIKELKEIIEKYSKEIGEYETAIAALLYYANSYKQLADKTKTMKQNLQMLIQEWTKIDSGLEEISEELVHASEWDKQTWAEVKTELQAARNKDDELCNQLSKLVMNEMQVVRKPVEVGMTEDELKTFIEKTGMIPLGEYIA